MSLFLGVITIRPQHSLYHHRQRNQFSLVLIFPFRFCIVMLNPSPSLVASVKVEPFVPVVKLHRQVRQQ